MRTIATLILTAAMGVATAQADTFTFSMGAQWGDADVNLVEWTSQGFTFTPALADNPKAKVPVYKKKNQECRFYALNTLTISAPEGREMTSVIFTLSKQGREEQAVITASAGAVDQQAVGNTTVTWKGKAPKVTFTVGDTNSLHLEGIADGSGQLDFTQIEIEDAATSGIDAIGCDNIAEASYYDLQGRSVTPPLMPGIYLRRQGDTATKIFIR